VARKKKIDYFALSKNACDHSRSYDCIMAKGET